MSLQLAPSVGKACALAQVAVELSLYRANVVKVPTFPATCCCYFGIDFHKGLRLAMPMAKF